MLLGAIATATLAFLAWLARGIVSRLYRIYVSPIERIPLHGETQVLRIALLGAASIAPHALLYPARSVAEVAVVADPTSGRAIDVLRDGRAGDGVHPIVDVVFPGIHFDSVRAKDRKAGFIPYVVPAGRPKREFHRHVPAREGRNGPARPYHRRRQFQDNAIAPCENPRSRGDADSRHTHIPLAWRGMQIFTEK